MSNQNKSSEQKKELSFIYILILSSFVTIFTISIAYYISNIKPSTNISISNIIESDYQMESLIIMQMQKYKQNQSEEPKILTKEIMPGMFMNLNCIKQNNEYIFEATVSGLNIQRKIKAKANINDYPDRLEFLD